MGAGFATGSAQGFKPRLARIDGASILTADMPKANPHSDSRPIQNGEGGTPFVGSRPVRLRLRLTATAESIVRGGHPWVYAASVREQNRAGVAGELAVIYDRNDTFGANNRHPHLSFARQILARLHREFRGLR
jgi:hypothetical protein